jgi:TonB-dependent receptor
MRRSFADDGNDIPPPTFGGLPLRINNNRTFATDLDVVSAYVMARFDGENLATPVPIRGNIGVRHVESDRATHAFTASDLLANGEQGSMAEIDFSDTLPSLNLIWDIREDLMLRFAWYESMVRPNANQYRADSSVDVDWLDPEETIPDDVDIELGNPDLLPFTADAWDVSLEWYNRKGSGISVAYFSKDVENGIEDRILCPANITDISSLDNFDFTGIITGQLSEVAGVCQDEVGVEVNIEDNINNTTSFTIDGWEIGLLQNFDFLDNWARGFGIQANYTDIDTSEGPDFDDAGNRLPLENVSENTYSNDTFTGDDRFVGESDRLDLSSSWRPTENLRLQAEIFNLTDETRVEYQGLPTRVRDLRYTGRIYTVGLRYRF